MAYPDGFTYVSGPYEIRRFNVLSTATFKARVPLEMGPARTVRESITSETFLVGIAMNDAANSIYGSEILVMVLVRQGAEPALFVRSVRRRQRQRHSRPADRLSHY